MIGDKLASASLQAFCTREELVSWLQALSRERPHGILAFIGGSSVGVEGSTETLRDPSLYRAFLYPVPAEVQSHLSMNDIRAREWGWIDVRPGSEINRGSDRFLLLSSIEAEDYENAPHRPVRDVQWLKRRLKPSVFSGVRGRNTVTGGESVYRNIVFTRGALEELKRGTKWVQDESGRAVFTPFSEP